MIRILHFLFPKNAFSKEEMRQILAYQDRINRNGVEPTGGVSAARIGRVVEGEYIRPGVDPGSCVHYTLTEKPQFAIYPIPSPEKAEEPDDVWNTGEVFSCTQSR